MSVSAKFTFNVRILSLPNLALVETKRIKVHRSLTPNSDWLAGSNKSSEPVLQCYFLDNFSVNSVSNEIISTSTVSDRKNVCVDSVSDEIVSALTQSAMKSFPSSSFIEPPATGHHRWSGAKKTFFKQYI